MAQCQCGVPAGHGVVTKEGPNKGRYFFRCPKWPNTVCSFFQWDNKTPPLQYNNNPPDATLSVVATGPLVAPVPQKFPSQVVENLQQPEWKTYSPATRESVEALEQRVRALEQSIAQQNVQLSVFFNNLSSMGKTWN